MRKLIKPVYPHPFETAVASGEVEQFHESQRLNDDCIRAIDASIHDNNYELYRYDLAAAVQTVTDEFGYERADWVMAGLIRQHHYDGRYNQRNKDWAREFDVPASESRLFVFGTHPCVLDGFADSLREAHEQQLALSEPEEVQIEQPIETEDFEAVLEELYQPQDYDDGPEEGPTLSL